ncbi:MAG TPA: hypothetical protein PKE26_08370 [Kiritimatiellia bacterium]|nr:hypothetical protein [Kiritimatiellia bacterium]HMO99108.1 hypothetical protein [Kiritimatiellia bacterium]HMP96942.1 hypothetical protein [Kiritimatiellia bacterium]
MKRRNIVMAFGVLLLAAVAMVAARLPRGVMPLDGATLERYQEANSKATRALMAKHPDMPYALRAATALRRAIRETGYNPDETVAAWLSPEFRRDLFAEDPAGAVGAIRFAEAQCAVALGTGADEETAARIAALWSKDVIKKVPNLGTF